MFQNQLIRAPSFGGTLKALEADIHHANTLADAVRRAYGGTCIQMKLSYSPLAPIFMFLMNWMGCSCGYSLPSYLGLLHVLVYKVYVDEDSTVSSYERRASLKEFYAVIYPSLRQLESNLVEKDDIKERLRGNEMIGRKRMEEWRKILDMDSERDDECGI